MSMKNEEDVHHTEKKANRIPNQSPALSSSMMYDDLDRKQLFIQIYNAYESL